jgi:hypothetical protein
VLWAVKKKYEQMTASNPRSVLSSMDREIANHCDEILKSDSLLDENIGSTGTFGIHITVGSVEL